MPSRGKTTSSSYCLFQQYRAKQDEHTPSLALPLGRAHEEARAVRGKPPSKPLTRPGFRRATLPHEGRGDAIVRARNSAGLAADNPYIAPVRVGPRASCLQEPTVLDDIPARPS